MLRTDALNEESTSTTAYTLPNDTLHNATTAANTDIVQLNANSNITAENAEKTNMQQTIVPTTATQNAATAVANTKTGITNAPLKLQSTADLTTCDPKPHLASLLDPGSWSLSCRLIKLTQRSYPRTEN